MTARMSCALTIDRVRDQTKTVTRRRIETWRNLQQGDRLTLIEKGMGLPKGARQVVLAEVWIVSVREETLGEVTADECDREGFPHLSPAGFTRMWAASHGYRGADLPTLRAIPCRRIEWRYLP